MNSYDSDRLLESVHDTHKQVMTPEKADVIVFNTCHIREKAAEKIYSELGMIKQIKQKNNNTKLIITGCVAQAEGKAMIKRQPMIDAVIGPQMYHKFKNLLNEVKKKRVIELDFESTKKFKKLTEKRLTFRSSSFVSIQEGCDKFCSFCVVPFTRGAESSRKAKDVYNEIVTLVDNGCKEVILLGQNVNAYHGLNKKGKEINLAELINLIEEIKGLERITYTTSHPIDMNQALIELHGSSKKLNPYLHLPVQSGSDRILNLMNRKYTIKEYMDIINNLKKKCPGIALSSDFIVGYPGETKQDFNETIKLVKEIDFAQAYSFKYSSRVGTKSSRITDEEICSIEKNERLQELQILLNEQQKSFNKSFISHTVDVLVKGPGKKKNQYRGTTKWMQVVNFESLDKIENFEKVKITKASNNSLLGDVI
ncbi:MAG: tRNA (N6-isopentenyl adenosine(37)-C2)-methylthiotransferase MiaB [Rickettsiales bacterium TMED131]|nr:MAG: tRNA (N6-isopentenyl adenosine(37)-C2)-methylthiotransferase MiaB [Rickettsiales bacterium TMED131]|tara:strand:+ start:840 stop:2111 length:1272 start_codon:yes stop_codon:yes gene_type:complete